MTNVISTLSADGHFERHSPIGAVPSPRLNPQGFAYNNKFYFGGGFVKANRVLHLTNQFHEYDPNSNKFTRLAIRGKQMTPRVNFAIAVLGDRVYIHGGCGRNFEARSDSEITSGSSLFACTFNLIFAFSYLYEKLCPFVRLSVHQSDRPSVRRSHTSRTSEEWDFRAFFE